MSSHSRARLRVCLCLSNADRMAIPHLAEIHLHEAYGQALLRATQARTWDATKRCLQKRHHNADGLSWSRNHHHYRSAVLPVLIMKQRRFRPLRPHRRLRWMFHREGDRKTFRKGLSLRPGMGQRPHRTIYHRRDPHHLQLLRCHHPHLQSCLSRRLQSRNQNPSHCPLKSPQLYSKRRPARQLQLSLPRL